MQILCKLLQASTYRPAQDGTGFVAVNLYRTMSRAVLPVRNTHQLPVSPSGQSRQIWPSTKPVYAKGGFENFHLTGLQICESSSGRTIEITDDTWCNKKFVQFHLKLQMQRESKALLLRFPLHCTYLLHRSPRLLHIEWRVIEDWLPISTEILGLI
jgi:hypothetical protein